jgi:acetyl-CoA carboxylase carboxyl transferase subunit beta
VTTGSATIRGHRVALLVGDFGFLGGSIGIAAGERLTAAIRRATAQQLPLVALPISGGTRMQEGTAAFLQMVKITHAVVAHKAAHLPYLVYLRDPTTGGVFASWGSLGHITIAEPRALIGFVGPRVYAALYHAPFPEGVQTAENLHRCGLIDSVVPLAEFGDLVDRALTVIRFAAMDVTQSTPKYALPEDIPAWKSVLASRLPNRPGARELLCYGATSVVQLRGSGGGVYDPSLVLALAQFGRASCVVLGQDRHTQTQLTPGALRQARRGMRLAADLQLPLVTLIDTPGGALSQHAEEAGLAGEIAGCIAEMVSLEVPTVSCILGQGTGGAALALLPADRILAAQHGWLAPLPPEGASAIVHHDITHAPSMAADQGVRSTDLLAHGIIDAVVPEKPNAADEPVNFCRRIGTALQRELLLVTRRDADARLADRADRFDRLGQAGSDLVKAG